MVELLPPELLQRLVEVDSLVTKLLCNIDGFNLARQDPDCERLLVVVEVGDGCQLGDLERDRVVVNTDILSLFSQTNSRPLNI